MKKLISVILSALLITAALCACKDKKAELTGKDVEYYAALGQMPECEYKIGDSVSEVKKGLGIDDEKESSESEEESEEPEAYSYESGDYTALSKGNSTYFYKTEGKDGKITAICSTGDGYGYLSGTVITTVQKEMEARGCTAKETELTEEEAFFMPVKDNFTCLKYDFSKCSVYFVFYDNGLCAVAAVSK